MTSPVWSSVFVDVPSVRSLSDMLPFSTSSGISVGMSGIGTGLAATLAYMNPADAGTYGQLMLMGGSGAGEL